MLGLCRTIPLWPQFRITPSFNHVAFRRALSNRPPPIPRSAGRIRTRFRILNARFPLYVQSWTTPLLDAPVSHIISFLVLHELTATIPLFGLAVTFHYTDWSPALSEWKWVKNGTERFGKYAKKKGWISDEQVREAENEVEVQVERKEEGKAKRRWLWSRENRSRWWKMGEDGSKWIVE